ncbi:MAG: hypothetical protein WDZ83_00885 [Rhizobiaceae bacterium]
MKRVWLSLSLVALVFAYVAPARADCQCVAAGKKYQLGEVACLSLPEGKRLARCGMVLNNSSWTKIEDACPLAFNETAEMSRPHEVAAAAPHDVTLSDPGSVRLAGGRDH